MPAQTPALACLGATARCETGPTGMRSRDPNICIPTEPDDSPPSIHDLHLGAARYMDDVLARTSLACRAFFWLLLVSPHTRVSYLFVRFPTNLSIFLPRRALLEYAGMQSIAPRIDSARINRPRGSISERILARRNP